jgi:hypothetical protein
MEHTKVEEQGSEMTWVRRSGVAEHFTDTDSTREVRW